MISLLSQLLAEAVHAFPRMFLIGAPVLVTAIAIAALLDAKVTGTIKGGSTETHHSRSA